MPIADETPVAIGSNTHYTLHSVDSMIELSVTVWVDLLTTVIIVFVK